MSSVGQDIESVGQHMRSVGQEMITVGEGKTIPLDQLDEFCYICKTTFKDLRTHRNRVHRERERSCPFCDATRSSDDMLRAHIKKHHRLETGQLSSVENPGVEPPKIQGDELRALMDTFVDVREDAYIIKSANFILSFNPQKKIANFGFETKTVSRLTGDVTRDCRQFPFRAYPPLGINQMVGKHISSLEQGYEAGHIIPAMYNGESLEDFKQTMMFPNLIPMHRTINLGLWKSSEIFASNLLGPDSLWKRLYILSGPVLDESNKKMCMGGCLYYIPVEVFKIYIMEAANGMRRMLCFLFPNTDVYDVYFRYLTSLGGIETRTGIQFTEEMKSIRLANEEEVGHRCKRCDSTFLAKTELQTHVRIHEGWIKCPICRNKEFRSSEELDAHYREAGHKVFICGTCGKPCRCIRHLNTHETTHSNDRPFPCVVENCTDRFKTQRDLTSHEKTHYEKFPCLYCPRVFKSYNNGVRRHMEKEHKVELPSKKAYREQLERLRATNLAFLPIPNVVVVTGDESDDQDQPPNKVQKLVLVQPTITNFFK